MPLTWAAGFDSAPPPDSPATLLTGLAGYSIVTEFARAVLSDRYR
jgi:hypothetical protein